MKQVLQLLVLSVLCSQIITEYVSGYSNETSAIYVNGTEFWLYSSSFPVDYTWITKKDTCTPTDPKSCSYMGDNYCCGTWTIDQYYQADLSVRISNAAYGNAWYATSYFNSFSGYNCELTPEFYNQNKPWYTADEYYQRYYDTYGIDLSTVYANQMSDEEATRLYMLSFLGYTSTQIIQYYDSRYMWFTCEDYQLPKYNRFEECDVEDRLSCREWGREYCCATYRLPTDLDDFFQQTYGDAQTTSIFSYKTGCEINPSYYNFTEWMYQTYDFGFYTCSYQIHLVISSFILIVTTLALPLL